MLAPKSLFLALTAFAGPVLALNPLVGRAVVEVQYNKRGDVIRSRSFFTADVLGTYYIAQAYDTSICSVEEFDNWTRSRFGIAPQWHDVNYNMLKFPSGHWNYGKFYEGNERYTNKFWFDQQEKGLLDASLQWVAGQARAHPQLKRIPKGGMNASVKHTSRRAPTEKLDLLGFLKAEKPALTWFCILEVEKKQ